MIRVKTGEVAIWDSAVVYRRGAQWQFRYWIAKEKRSLRRSLHTRNEETAIERGKQLYLQVLRDLDIGKQFFSITLAQAVEQYLTHRQTEVSAGVIVKGRWTTIHTHLQHFVRYLNRSTSVRDIEAGDGVGYGSWRTSQGVSTVTVLNEQTSVNALLRWCRRQGYTQLEGLEWQRLPKTDYRAEAQRRQTFTDEEWQRFSSQAQVYPRKRTSDDIPNRRLRTIAAMFFLVQAATGMRTGEQRQLRWTDIATETHAGQVLNRIQIRAETSKVRTSREFLANTHPLLRRLQRILNPSGDSLVFSVNGTSAISESALLHHWRQLEKIAAIERRLVPYCLRHLWVTQKASAGCTFDVIAQIAGTSVTQIERTYYHLRDDARRTVALA